MWAVEAAQRTGMARHFRELGLERHARLDMKPRQPLAEAGAEPSRQALLAAEIDNVQLAACRQPLQRPCKCILPGRDHRQAVRKEDARETRHAKQQRRIEACGIGAGEADACLEPRSIDGLAGGCQRSRT